MSRLCQAHNDVLARDYRVFNVAGHVLELPFSDKAEVGNRGLGGSGRRRSATDPLSSSSLQVVRAVLNTGVHRLRDSATQFSVSVHIEPTEAAYAFTIWVYVVSLRRSA